MADLFGGVSQTFEYYTDPCDTSFGSARRQRRLLGRRSGRITASRRRPVASPRARATQSPIPFLSGSNPDLTPETSESKTLGFVWSPSFAEGLNLSLDWWNIRIENTIVADSPTDILNDCYVRGIASRCAGVDRVHA